jgi:amino acid adenylation domain-containing protein
VGEEQVLRMSEQDAVYRIVERLAIAHPERIAIKTAGECTTYAVLNRQANRLARRLVERGIGTDDRVGVLMPRTAGLVAALLAVHKAGGAYVPIDPAYPEARVRLLLEDSDARCVVAPFDLACRFSDAIPESRLLDVALPPATAREATSDLDIPAPLDSLAYVMYTSGSSGRPKGVMVEHGSLAAFVAAVGARLGVSPGDRVFGVTTISFDLSVFDVFLTLSHGAVLCLASEVETTDPRTMARTIGEVAPTLMLATPATWRMLILHGWQGLPGIRCLSCGEALPRRLADDLLDRGLEVWNAYGPTEATVFTSLGRIDRGSVVDLGRPLEFATMEILDEGRQFVVPGQMGELYLGGRCVSRGYLGEPDLTTECFVTVPGLEGRWFRSGDLCRRDDEGRLILQGRADQQVKVRGFRVELGEVESALEAIQGVDQAIVTGLGDDVDRRLVAYVTGLPQRPGDDEGDALASDRIRAALNECLPAHLVPSSIIVLDAMPMTPNGKVDRSRLPAPDSITVRAPGLGAEPTSPTQRQVQRIFCDVLGVADIGIREDFFQLGGHSLDAVAMVVLLEQVIGVALPVATVFSAPTIEALAGWVDGMVPGAEECPMPLARRDVQQPLSSAQQRLWYLESVEQTNCAYYEPLAMCIRGPVGLPRLRRSVEAVISRHEALRTSFPASDHEPYQAIGDVELAWTVDDLTDAPMACDALAEQLRAAARRPLDIENGPLLRVTVFRLGPEQHVFLLTIHHLVVDDRTARLICDEIATAYAHPGEPAHALLVPPERQFVDFANWQRGQATRGVLEPHLRYWEEHLAGVPTTPPLQADHIRPPRFSYRGASHAFAIERTVVDAVDALSRSRHQTTFSTLLAAVGSILSHEADRSSIVIGTPVSQRQRRVEQEMAGFFLNMLPVRIDVDPECTFAEVAGLVHGDLVRTFQHAVAPLDQIIERIHPVRDWSHSTLFQIVFVWLEEDSPTITLPGCTSAVVPVDTATSKFDLTVEMRRTNEGIEGRLEYATDLFDAATIERIAQRLVRGISAFVRNPDQAIGLIATCTDDLTGRLAQLNATECPYPRESTLDELFRAQARRTPLAPAVLDGAQTISYRTLDERADSLATRLLEQQVAPNTRIALDLPRSAELVVGVLAILKAGSSYVPLDVAAPAPWRQRLVEETECAAILCRAGRSDAAPSDTPLINVNTHSANGASPLPGLGMARSEEDEAYVMFTSGSSGVPKGVAVPHRAVARLVCAQDYLPFDDKQVFLFHSNPSFDASTLELWGPLLHGSRLVIAPETALDLVDLAERIQTGGVTCLWLTAALFNALVDDMPEALRGVPWVATGGEALSVPHVRAALELLDGTSLVNGYGPTETTTFACTHRIPRDLSENASSVPIGRPLANTRIYLLDDQRQPVAPGAPGELWIGGEGVALGYVNDVALTEDRFLPDCFHDAPNARMYRTGDRARLLEDGTIEFLGRMDRQIKIRGFRVEPGEVEAALQRLDSVGQAAVDVGEQGGNRHLVAYVTPGTTAPTPEGLRATLLKTVPRHLVPSGFVVLDAMPLSASGKIDRARLSVVAGLQKGRARTDTERHLVRIWRDVLRVDAVGVDDDFFVLGGHSLRAVFLLAQVEQVFGVALPLATLREAATVRTLAAAVEAARPDGPAASIPSADRTRPLPLSFEQQRMWFLECVRGVSGAYNEPFALRIGGPLDSDRLQRALAAIVDRHEILRTTFYTNDDGQPFQEIHDSIDVPWSHLDLAGGSNDEDAVAECLAEEARRPFDLRHGPLLRPLLITLGPDAHAFQLTFHHAIVDDMTVRIVFGDLEKAYGASGSSGGALGGVLGGVPTRQYADYALWQRTRTDGARLEPHLRFWEDYLRDLPHEVALAGDRPRPETFSHCGAARPLPLAKADASALRAFSQARRHSVFTTLLASIGAVLAHRAGSGEILLGTPVSMRRNPTEQEMAGFFLNMLPIRIDCRGDPTFADLVDRVKRDLDLVLAHRDAPFEQIVRRVGPSRSRSHSPIFQVAFVWLEDGQPSVSVHGCEVTPLSVHTSTAKFDLTVELRRDGDSIEGQLEYATDLFDPGTIDAIGRDLAHFLARMVAEPQGRISVGLPEFTGVASDARLARSVSEQAPTPRATAADGSESPADALERVLLDLWRSVLKRPTAALDDDFFELGGHSLLAARLAARASRDLGMGLPVNLVFQAPTVRRLAAMLRGPRATDAFTAIAVQPRGTQPPVFYVPGLGGSAFVLPDLSRHLGDDQPIYALQAHPVERPMTVEELGAACVECIRGVAPNGPYRLAGFSLGGTYAFEAAQQIVAAGARVDLLMIIDHIPPDVRWDLESAWRVFANLPFWVSELLRNPPKNLPRVILKKLRSVWLRMTGRHKAVRAGDFVDLSEWSDEMRSVADTHFNAYRDYRPRPFPGRIVLVRARRQPILAPTGRQHGWGPLARDGVVEHVISGGHMGILAGDGAARLASFLHDALVSADVTRRKGAS